MRFLPVPTGGKPSKWSAFSEKNLFSLPTGQKGAFWSTVLRKKFPHFPLPTNFQSDPHFPVFFLSTTHWRVLPVLNERFWIFPPSLSSGGEGVVLTKLGSFFPQYPLEGFAGFERKILKISSFSTHLTETGEVVRFFGNFFLPLPTGEKWAVWPKRSETFSLQCPLDSSGLFERKIFIFSFLQYPLDKNHCFDQKDLKFFLPVPNGHEGPFWTKEKEKSPRKFSEGSRKIHIVVL